MEDKSLNLPWTMAKNESLNPRSMALPVSKTARRKLTLASPQSVMRSWAPSLKLAESAPDMSVPMPCACASRFRRT